MLMDIKKLLIEREEMSLADLARHFYVSEAVMEAMLAQWQKKGRIVRFDAGGACSSSCGGCSESNETATSYRWKPIAEKPIFTRVNTD